MKSRNLLLCLLMVSIISLIGCATAPTTKKAPDHFYGKSYAINQVSEATIGSTMLQVKNAYLWPSFRPKFTYQPADKSLAPIEGSQEWVAFYYYGNDYLINSKSYHNGWLGMIVDKDGNVFDQKPMVRMGIVNPNYWDQPIQHRLSIGELQDPQLFTPLEGYPKEGSFKAELVYNGIMKNVIHISYREYTDNMARPAFYQDVRYDLDETRDISFRSLKIKVISADNSKIVFKVIDDGDLPWMPKDR
jgi:hypothetical protein